MAAGCVIASVLALAQPGPARSQDAPAQAPDTAAYYAKAAKSPLTRGAEPVRAEFVTLRAGDLEGDITGNSYGRKPHCAGYNGISRLVHTADPQNAFVDYYAGINFEHIWDGSPEYMEPRKGRLSLWRFGPESVGVYRAAEDETRWHLESMTRFTFAPPHYIDIEFTCIPREPVFKGDCLGMFWASYMNGTEDSSLKFLGRERGEPADEPARWISAFSPAHNVFSSHLPVYEAAGWRQTIPGTNWPGLAASFSNYENTLPFFFGRVRKMVWAVMFDERVFTATETLRFSQSPVGGGGEGYPAWDFHFLVRPCVVGRTYGWRARCLYKPFAGNEDVLAEYRTWSGRPTLSPPPREDQTFTVRVEGTVAPDDGRFSGKVILRPVPQAPGGTFRYETEPNAKHLWKKITRQSPEIKGTLSVDRDATVGIRYFARDDAPRGPVWERHFVPVDFRKTLTTGKPATASRSNSEYPPALAVDGIVQIADWPRTWWESQDGPQWLRIDLEKPMELGEIDLYTYWDGSRYYQYAMDVSIDGEHWTQVADATGNTTPATAEGYRHTIKPVTARYLRVTMLKNSANPGLHIVEVRAYPPPSLFPD